VWFLLSKSVVFVLQKYGFYLAKEPFLQSQSMVISF